MIKRLDAVKAGWVFTGFAFGHIPKEYPEYRIIEQQLEKVFVNPAFTLKQVVEKYQAGEGSNQILEIAFHGLPDYILIWFRVGQTVNVTSVDASKLDEADFELAVMATRGNLSRAGLDSNEISNLISLIEQLRNDAIVNGLTMSSAKYLGEIDSLIQKYAAKADIEANKPIIHEVNVGNIFANISNSTIVNESQIRDSFNKVLSEKDKETAEALVKIAEEIEKSGNLNAAALYKSFNQELQKSHANPSILRALWDGITKELPTIKGMVEVVGKITSLFA